MFPPAKLTTEDLKLAAHEPIDTGQKKQQHKATTTTKWAKAAIKMLKSQQKFFSQFFKTVFLIFLGVYSLSVPALYLQGRIVAADMWVPFEAIGLIGASAVCLVWAGNLVRGIISEKTTKTQ